MLSLHKLEIFLAVVQEGKMSRAAERLFMTQAAISQHIHDLESSLGVSLFERHSQGVRLTAAGESLLRYANDIVWMVAAAENDLTQVKNLSDGEMAIGFTPAAASLFVLEWIRRFQEEYPAIKVVGQTGTTSTLLQSLRKQRIDLAFVEGELGEISDLHVVNLRQTHIVVVVAADHRWSGRSFISIQELANEPYLARQDGSHTYSWTMEIFARFGLTPKIAAKFDDIHAIQRAITQNMGVSLLPACLVQEECDQGQLKMLDLQEFPDLHRMLKVVWHSGLPLKPIPKAFLNMLALHYPQLQIQEARKSLPNPHRSL